MEIGVIGAGDFGQAFAKRALKAGHNVKLGNSRGPGSLLEIVNQLGPGAVAATAQEVVACEMVLLAVPWDNVPKTLASLPKWKNQILIDGTNPFHGKAEVLSLPMLGICPLASSLRRSLLGRVVKALNNMTVPNLGADPVVNGARRVAFISADDGAAKKQVENLLKGFGYSVIDLGNLRDGGLLQQAGGPLAGRDLLERGEYSQ
jgi:8-hydroxy-5-deazaflavin:NADPH oxidoreductase